MPFVRLRPLVIAVAGMLHVGLAAASAQDKAFELKISHWLAPTHPLHTSLDAWGNAVEKASGGTLKFKLFPAGELGKAFGHYDMAREGTADLALVNPGFQPGRFPILDAVEFPLLVSDAASGSRAVDIWYREHAAEMKDVKFCLAFVSDPGSFHAKKKIATPADLKGMKVFTMQATMGALVEQFGAKRVNPGAPDPRALLDKGLADAVTATWGSVPLQGIDKATKYHLEAPLYVTASALVINRARYGEMSEAQRKAIDDHCTSEWAETIAAPWAAFERAGIAKVKSDPANEVYGITAAQLSHWLKAATPLEKAWAGIVKKAGADPGRLMKSLRGTLAEYKAAVDRPGEDGAP